MPPKPPPKKPEKPGKPDKPSKKPPKAPEKPGADKGDGGSIGNDNNNDETSAASSSAKEKGKEGKEGNEGEPAAAAAGTSSSSSPSPSSSSFPANGDKEGKEGDKGSGSPKKDDNTSNGDNGVSAIADPLPNNGGPGSRPGSASSRKDRPPSASRKVHPEPESESKENVKKDEDGENKAKDTKDTKDTKDSKDSKDDAKDTKDAKNTKDTKDAKDTKDTKDAKDAKDAPEPLPPLNLGKKDTPDETKDSKDSKEASSSSKDASKDDSKKPDDDVGAPPPLHPKRTTANTGASDADIDAIAADSFDDFVPNPPTEAAEFRAKIESLKAEFAAPATGDAQHPVITPYLDEFDAEMRASEDVLVIGAITVEEAEQQEAILEAQRVAQEVEEARRAKARIEDLEQRERAARARLVRDVEQKRNESRRLDLKRRDQERRREEETQRQFKRAEEELRHRLEARKAEIQTRYGDLRSSKVEYGGFKGRKWLVDWERTPQPVKIRLDVLRGCKDKIPEGRYVMVVSLYDRIGGSELRWSQLRRQTYNGSTLPIIHSARFTDVELRMNQNVYLVVPSRTDMSPSMVYLFELFLLKGRHCSVDTVVAWGAFPVYDNALDPCEGAFKVPMLRGPTDESIDRFDKVARVIGSDVEHWLGNLYFRVSHMSKYADNKREYEVELQLTGERLGNPSRRGEIDEEEDLTKMTYEDDEPTRGGKKKDKKGRKKYGGKKSNKMNKVKARRSGKGLLDTDSEDEDSDGPPVAPKKASRQTRGLLDDDDFSDGDDSGGGGGMFTIGERNSDVRVTAQERRLARTLRGALDSSDESDGDDPVRAALRGDSDAADEDGVYRYKQPKLIDSRLLERYQMSAARNLQTSSEAWAKMQFIYRDITNDVGLKQWRTLDFWVFVVMLLLAFWLRMYMHYFGQWVYLYVMKAPFVEFAIHWHTVDLTYQADLVPLSFEIGMVTAGLSFNFLFWVFMMLIAILSQKLIGYFPSAYSRWMMVYGFGVFLDWFLVLVIDCIIANWKGDAFKLYNLYYASEKNGVAGIFLVAFIDVSFNILVAAIFYNYMLHLHNNGRVFDTYSRLNAFDEDFELPHDFEIAIRELRWVCAKSERYRGTKGERRKIAVSEVTLTDENDPEWEGEKTVHIGIFTFFLDGRLELHRHFMRLPDGAIVEVFGGMAGIRNESRLWLDRTGVEEVSGRLEDFLSGRLGKQGGIGIDLSYRNDTKEVKGLSAPPLIGAPAASSSSSAGANVGDKEKKKTIDPSKKRKLPTLMRGGRIIQ